ncbi:DNA-3-methyladenine glycosylase 2 family protein [Wukongibacter sp. M2B1]|uniref:DNA-3-methyladenine glycosylase 2 family protein n=1 Tax=Wukongibacter sp. M2B1 TaxID=3088895 RepID=UPI003D79230C
MGKTIFHTARITKDKNYDGKFFFGVKTTGIFCRPSCPAPVAKEENVLYFDTMFEALEQGFRPCLRCRPDVHVEYYNGNIDGAKIVSSALKMIYEGYLNYNSISDLAKEFFISDRHLRKLFVKNLGIPPVKIVKYHKSLFAKKLLSFSDLSVTDIAFASGFGSTRQFNHVFKEIFGITPTMVRKERSNLEDYQDNTTLLLKYEKPFDFKQILSFMKSRAIKGVEIVTENSYSRTFRMYNAKGYFTVSNNIEKSSLELKINCDDIKCYMTIYNKVRRMFDLDTDFSVINEKFMKDEILQKGMMNGRVPRLPIAFDTFEFVIRAILGQQITVKAATTLACRIVERAGIKGEDHFIEGLDYFFPNPLELLTLDLDGLGITKTREATIKTAVNAIINGDVSLSVNQPFEKFYSDFSSLKGIGDWTVNYVAMRGMGMVDSFPSKDLGIIKALTEDGKTPSQKEIMKLAERWRPYRAYATLCLWNYESKREGI